jgi:hypothetical protein
MILFKARLIFFLLSTSLVIACNNVPNPEVDLRARSSKAYEYVTNSDWQQVHKFFSPSFQEYCPVSQYENKNVKGMAKLNAALGIPEGNHLTFAIKDISVIGTQGQVYIDIYYGDNLLDLGQSGVPRNWVLENGEWWSNPTDWAKECPK